MEDDDFVEYKLKREEVEKILESDYTGEYKFIQKNGKRAREAFLNMADSEQTVHSQKLDKELTLRFTYNKKMKQEDTYFIMSGSPYYKIQLLDGDKELGECTYSVNKQQGIHLAYIGINEKLDDSYQGKGIGSMLMNALEEQGRAFGAQTIEGLFVPMGKFADHSKDFYLRHGFTFEIDYEDHGKTFFSKSIEPALKAEKQESNEQIGDKDKI